MNIYKQPGITKLKRNQKLTPNKIFLIGSESVTNSLYFRRVKDIEKAHSLIREKLHGILSVIDYLFTPKGWLLVVKIKSKNTIISFYKRMRGLELKSIIKYDAGRIISEIIRTTISTLVGFINKGSKRKGTLVYRAFIRFSIDSLSDLTKILNKMKRRELILSNQKKQFSPRLKKWKNSILPVIGMEFLSSEETNNKDNLHIHCLNRFTIKVKYIFNKKFLNNYIDQKLDKNLIINIKKLS